MEVPQAGLKEASKEFIILADADLSYDLEISGYSLNNTKQVQIWLLAIGLKAAFAKEQCHGKSLFWQPNLKLF